MQGFVEEYFQNMMGGRHQQTELTLKKIRFRHEVLSQVRYNSFKLVLKVADLVTLDYEDQLYNQGEDAKFVYFILYGALKVTYQREEGEICDIVRGGNVIGEESLFGDNRTCMESVENRSKKCVLYRLGAAELIQMQTCQFQSLGSIGRAQHEQDFRALFDLLARTHKIKEQWRKKANTYLVGLA